MSAHAIFAASWPLLFSGIFAPVQTGGVAVIVTLTVTAPKLLTFTHKLDLLTSWLWPMGGFGVDGRLLFVTFGTFVIVHPIPHVNAQVFAFRLLVSIFTVELKQILMCLLSLHLRPFPQICMARYIVRTLTWTPTQTFWWKKENGRRLQRSP